MYEKRKDGKDPVFHYPEYVCLNAETRRNRNKGNRSRKYQREELGKKNWGETDSSIKGMFWLWETLWDSREKLEKKQNRGEGQRPTK